MMLEAAGGGWGPSSGAKAALFLSGSKAACDTLDISQCACGGTCENTLVIVHS